MPANLFEQQASNRRRTWAVMALFVAFLFLLGYGFDRFYLESLYPIVGFVALVFGSFSAVSSYRHGDRAVLASCKAVEIGQLQLEAATPDVRYKLTQLGNVVDEMALASGLPRPKLYLIDDPDPNAFATGRDPERASIAVTAGLLDALSRDELQGVIAHELGHVRNYDMRLMTVVAALVGAIALIADWTMRVMRFGGGGGGKRGKDKGGAGGIVLVAVWVIGIILAPVIAQLLAMLVSRNREYLADASGAELTRNPLALASALAKVEGAAGPTRAIKRGTANLCIADPLARPVGRKEGWWANLLASHPPMERRIQALRGMAYVG
ncbi:MAG: Zn-dependent protease with chaperone function [Acidobacteria bacterium]|nr:Zn-dependent protease with chaperone function [Acidobacteriota bacterium]